MSDLNLSLIGNNCFSALIDCGGRIVWMCFPRLDADPLFNSLVNRDSSFAVGNRQGFSDVMIENFSHSAQSYLDATSMVLRTVLHSSNNCSVEILDFAPRLELFGRSFRGALLLRRIRPLQGNPLICVRCRPTFDYNTIYPDISSGSNHIRYLGSSQTLRMTTDLSISCVFKETTIVLDEPKHLIIGTDESLTKGIVEMFDRFLQNTQAHWRTFSHALTLPVEWQDEVMRSAMVLNALCYSDTGLFVAACTSGIPGKKRQSGLDGRICLMRNAAIVTRAMCRLNMTQALDQYLRALNSLVVKTVSSKQSLPPCVSIQLDTVPVEEEAKYLAGYRGIGTVKIGAPEWLQESHVEAYGSVIYALSLAFYDHRVSLHERADEKLFSVLETLGHAAFELHDKPGYSSYIQPTSVGDRHVHTVAVLYCWLACVQLLNIGRKLVQRGFDCAGKVMEWESKVAILETYINTKCVKNGVYTAFAAADGHEYESKPHPSLLLMHIFGFSTRNWEIFQRTLEALSANENLVVNTAYLFWLVEAKAVRQPEDARRLLLSLLRCCSGGGLFGAYLDLNDHSLWGNLPDAQSTAAMISAAFAVSRDWSEVL